MNLKLSAALVIPLLAAPAALARPGASDLASASFTRDGDGSSVALGRWIAEDADPVVAARRWLEGPAAGMVGDAELTLHRVQSSPIGTHVTFQQRAGGLPVLDGWARVTVSGDGLILGGWSSTRGARSGAVRLSADDARARALDALGAPVLGPLPISVSLGAAESGPQYRVEVPALEPMGVWRIHIDAATGQAVGPIEDVAAYRTGTGQVFYVNASVALETNSLRDLGDRARAVPRRAYFQVDLLEIGDDGYLVGPYVDTRSLNSDQVAPFSTSGTFDYDRANNSFEAVQAYWALDYAQRYIQGLGFDDVNNRQIQVSVASYPADNSFYSSGTITLGSGGVDDGEDSEVIWHEMGHAIHADQVPGWGSSQEARSMGEGFGDFIAASLGSDFSDGFQDACVAEWDAISYSNTNPPCLRRVDTDKVYPDDLNGEVHADGEIWSAALWDQRSNLGNEETLTILLASHFLLSPSASMEEAAAAFTEAAAVQGVGTLQLDRIRATFADHGLM